MEIQLRQPEAHALLLLRLSVRLERFFALQFRICKKLLPAAENLGTRPMKLLNSAGGYLTFLKEKGAALAPEWRNSLEDACTRLEFFIDAVKKGDEKSVQDYCRLIDENLVPVPLGEFA